MQIKSCKGVISEFRESRGQSTEPSKQIAPPPKKKNSGYSPYDSFKKKYDSLEENIDSFGTRDLVYYFRELSEETGHKYVVSNIKKDMSIMKRLMTNYTNRQICGMIEFLYMSEQDYIEKDRISPNLLASSWVNTIYADTMLWVDDKYTPNKKKSQKTQSRKLREWNSDEVKDQNSNIGIKL